MIHFVLPFFSYPYTPFFSGNSFIQNSTCFLQPCKGCNYLLTVTLYYFSCREVCGFCKGSVKSHGMQSRTFSSCAINHCCHTNPKSAAKAENPCISCSGSPQNLYKRDGQPFVLSIRGVLNRHPRRAQTPAESGSNNLPQRAAQAVVFLQHLQHPR